MTVTALSQSSIDCLKTVVNFCKPFHVDIIKISQDGVVGLDDPPTLALFATPNTQYDGPELFLNRLKVLDTRLAGSKLAVGVQYNAGGVALNLEIKSGKKSIDFRLAATSGKLPATFKGTFATQLQISKQDFSEITQGAKSIGSDIVTIAHKNGVLQATASSEGERFQYLIDDDTGEDSQYSYNYSTEHLSTIEKLLPDQGNFIGNITPRGQMMVEIKTETVDASIFILDIKNR